MEQAEIHANHNKGTFLTHSV